MRGARNADLYGPLQDEWIKGKAAGTDAWIHKNRYVHVILPRCNRSEEWAAWEGCGGPDRRLSCI